MGLNSNTISETSFAYLQLYLQLFLWAYVRTTRSLQKVEKTYINSSCDVKTICNTVSFVHTTKIVICFEYSLE